MQLHRPKRNVGCFSVTEGAISISRRQLAYFRTQLFGHTISGNVQQIWRKGST